MTSALKSSILKLIEPVLDGEGIDLVDVEFEGKGRRKTLRLLIHKPNAVTIADCKWVSQVVQPILEVHGLIEPSFNLEVASPGIDRPLVTEADFRRNIGQNIKVEVSSSSGTFSELSGTLKAVDGENILLNDSSGKTVRVKISTITTGQIELIW